MGYESKGWKVNWGGWVNTQHPPTHPQGAWGLTYLDRLWQLRGGTSWFVNQKVAGIRG